MNDTVDSLIAYCRVNERVCPKPTLWNQLWELLPNRKRVGLAWEPPLPLILAAWYETPAMVKMDRLEEHIKWAGKQDSIERIATFLRGLKEEDWHHLGE